MEGNSRRQGRQVSLLHDIRQYMSYKVAWCWASLSVVITKRVLMPVFDDGG